MATPVYSTRLFYGQIPGVTETTIFTVPNTLIYVVRDIETRAPFTSGQEFRLQIAGTGLALTTVTPAVNAVAAQWQGRIVLNPGEVITGSSSHNPCTVCISGFALEVPTVAPA